ncbi:MAG: iron ABC transporter permease [Chloroflexi bacterium]|nr:iron ABC transporter permease [Chloroflexota bacterium]
MSRRWFFPLGLNVALLAAALIWSLVWGPVSIPPRDLGAILLSPWRPELAASLPKHYTTIVWDVRLPRAVLMALVGMALGGSGAAFQGLFRNPLADPYLLGVASGAGLGAVLAFSLAWPRELAGMYRVPAFAFGTALLTVALVHLLARGAAGSVSSSSLLLAGIAVSATASALMSYLMLRSEGELRRALVYLLGGAPMLGWDPILAMSPYLALGLAGLVASGHILNVLQFGEEQAHYLGLAVNRARMFIIAAASLSTAAAVAFGGIIGFIGLMVPHAVRLLWGADYRRVLPLSILLGGTTLVLFDWLARMLLRPRVLPVGVVTSLVGGPFFLWILRRHRPGVQ